MTHAAILFHPTIFLLPLLNFLLPSAAAYAAERDKGIWPVKKMHRNQLLEERVIARTPSVSLVHPLGWMVNERDYQKVTGVYYWWNTPIDLWQNHHEWLKITMSDWWWLKTTDIDQPRGVLNGHPPGPPRPSHLADARDGEFPIRLVWLLFLRKMAVGWRKIEVYRPGKIYG